MVVAPPRRQPEDQRPERLIAVNDPRRECFLVERVPFGERLDVFLQGRYPAASRGAIQRLIKSGDILVNGRAAKSSLTPRAGDRVEVRWPEPQSAEAKPEAIALSILFEDDDLVVIDKPPGLVVHPAAGHAEHTLVNALLHHCAGGLSGIGGVARPGIVHRLDKDTSGCLVAAKNDEAHLSLTQQFARRSIEKVYHAILCGELPVTQGEIHAAIARHPTHRQRMAVTQTAGREAWTTFRVLEKGRGITLVEATLHTGRTHQIRVHFQHLGYPLAGDAVYGLAQNRKLLQTTGFSAPRQMLHARRLAFDHPRSGQRIRVAAPWPADFLAAIEPLPHASEIALLGT